MTRPTLQVAPPASGVSRLALGRPLDRIEDLMVHQQLGHFLDAGKKVFDERELQQVLDDSRWARDAEASVSRRSRRYWLMKWLESQVGGSLDAVVLERAGTGLLVELSNCRLVTFIPGGRESWAHPGDAIRADLGRVSARRDLIELVNPRPLEPGPDQPH